VLLKESSELRTIGHLSIIVQSLDQLLAVEQSVCECTVDWGQTSQHNRHEGKVGGLLSGRLLNDGQDVVHVLFQVLNEVVGEVVAHFVDLVEERVHHVVFDLEVCELGLVGLVLVVGLRDELGDAVLEQVRDRFGASQGTLRHVLVVTFHIGG